MSAEPADWRRLGGRLRRLREPGPWLAAVLAVGALVRIALCLGTTGTLDVVVWSGLSDAVLEQGLMATYAGGRFTQNHPPVAALLVAGVRSLSAASDVPFATLFRLPFALLDLGTFALLVRLFGAAGDPRWRRARWVIAAAWWLSPIAIVFSSFHGNTDSAVAFFLVAAATGVATGRPALAGAMVGLGLWIKIPGILAAPLLLLALPGMRARVLFAASAGAVAIVGYGPWLAQDFAAVFRSVFLYPGLRIQTTAGMPIWGLEALLPDWREVSREWRAGYHAFLLGWLRANTIICLAPILLLAFVRRGRDRADEIAAGIAATYVILYGLSNLWSFQYLAWSAPFWAALGLRFWSIATLLATAYVYGLYAWLCGSPLLVGPWDFVGKPDWPLLLRLARNAAIVFFAGAAVWQIATAVRDERTRWRRREAVG